MIFGHLRRQELLLLERNSDDCVLEFLNDKRVQCTQSI